MKFTVPLLFFLISCMSGNEKLVREHLETNMKISQSNLDIVTGKRSEERRVGKEC